MWTRANSEGMPSSSMTSIPSSLPFAQAKMKTLKWADLHSRDFTEEEKHSRARMKNIFHARLNDLMEGEETNAAAPANHHLQIGGPRPSTFRSASARPASAGSKAPLRWKEAHPEPVTPRLGPADAPETAQWVSPADKFEDAEFSIYPPGIPFDQTQSAAAVVSQTQQPLAAQYWIDTMRDYESRGRNRNVDISMSATLPPVSPWSAYYDLYDRGYNVEVVTGTGTQPYVFTPLDSYARPSLPPNPQTTYPTGASQLGENDFLTATTFRGASTHTATSALPQHNSLTTAPPANAGFFRSSLIRPPKSIHHTTAFRLTLAAIALQGIAALLSLAAQSDLSASSNPGHDSGQGSSLPEQPFAGQIDVTTQGSLTLACGLGVGAGLLWALLTCAGMRSRTGRPARWCRWFGVALSVACGIAVAGCGIAVVVGRLDGRDLRMQSCVRANERGAGGSSPFEQGVNFGAICGKATAAAAFAILAGLVWVAIGIVEAVSVLRNSEKERGS
ncbi:hypothetical protein HK101_004403 [Irineochytrium annulatum]|nr:hypothetical protein HK101_004403 [Irineochytrium annulatum]